MPRLPLIVAASLALTTLGGCASEVVSSARESRATTTTAAIANAAAESPAEPPATPPPTTARPAAPAAKTPAAPGTTTAPPTTTVTPAGGADLTSVIDPQLGKLVADQNGMTAYFLTTDLTTKPPQSTCLDDCAKLWPPILLPASGSVRVDGIDAKLLGKLTRPDRTIQLTLAGHPLYRFIGDTTPGDTLGHGLAATAFAISPTGAKAATPAAKG